MQCMERATRQSVFPVLLALNVNDSLYIADDSAIIAPTERFYKD